MYSYAFILLFVSLSLIGIISFLLPITLSLLGVLSVLSNRNKGPAKYLMIAVFLLLTYKFGQDILIILGLLQLQTLVFLFGIPLMYLIAPLIYKYFQSLLLFEKEFDFNILKHSYLFFIISALNILLFVFMTKEDYLSVLNYRFEGDHHTFESIKRILLFTLSAPFLLVQWIFYHFRIKGLFVKQKKDYGKFFGSFEKRNRVLSYRIFNLLLFSFLISFLTIFIRLENTFFDIIGNVVISSLLFVVILSSKEQIDMRGYRMYKLSSHLEEIGKNIES